MKRTTLHLITSITAGLALIGSAAHADTPASDAVVGSETRSLETWAPEPEEMFRVDEKLLAKAKESGLAGNFTVDLQAQRAYLMVDGRIAIETRVCTGRRGKETPLGSYRVSQKVRSGKRSTIYGCKLPYWMRLTNGGIGLHVGEVRDKPSSAGCIRLPAGVAPLVYERMPRGSQVTVVSSLAPDKLLAVR